MTNMTPLLRIVTIIGFALTSALLGMAAFSAASWREAYVFLPREHAVEEAMRQVVERQRNLYDGTGEFVSFAHGDVERDRSLMDLPWDSFPTDDFFFDAASLETGNLRLRALPRPAAVQTLGIRPRMFVSELSPDGEVVSSRWFPPIGSELAP